MHELFLTASVNESDFDTTCAILQGLCWMTARRSIYRILYFSGQPQPRGLPNAPPQGVLRPQDKALWTELNKQLLRSSYVLQAAWEVNPETDFGKEGAGGSAAAPTMDLNRNGMLRWTDLPDPLKDSPVTSRKKIEVPFLGFLPHVLADNKHTYTSELIQESYSFNRGELEIVLSRYYQIPNPSAEGGNNNNNNNNKNIPMPNLPKWTDLRPVDSAQKWIVTVKMDVSDDGSVGQLPEKLAKANEELSRNKAEFEKLFRFQVIDRRVFDTRIPPPPVVPGRGP